MKHNRLILLLPLLLSLGCSGKKQKAPPPPFVKVAKVITKDVPLYIYAVGHVQAYESVEIKSQVTGVIEKVHFERGADVKEGELLFTIDQSPFIAALQRAEAILAENLANLNYSVDIKDRNAPLVKDDYISQIAFDQLVTNVLVSEATVDANTAEVETAKINLAYCSIHAPMDSRAGDYLVDEGNLVLENGETDLVTLNQITPIYAAFYITEKQLQVVQRYQQKHPLKAMISVEDPEVETFEGDLVFIDNAVNLATGMLKMMAVVPNEKKILWPGQFVTAKLILETLKNAKLIPAQAVQNSVKGKFVWVITPENTAEIRYVDVGQREVDDYVILKGLKEGEMVVLEGQIRLRPGGPVTIKESQT